MDHRFHLWKLIGQQQGEHPLSPRQQAYNRAEMESRLGEATEDNRESACDWDAVRSHPGY
jgi:hypothetical protein